MTMLIDIIKRKELIIRDTHRGLWYENGALIKIITAGKYKIPLYIDLGIIRNPKVDVVIVDMRERDITIKGQEILTADKVAIRVSIIVQFKVQDPKAAIHAVENYEERLYSDVQLAARRSLAAMKLEEILTNRNHLSEDILRDIKESAANYGVLILRADIKDLIFPGDVQEIMNRVLKAERLSQAQLVEAKSRVEIQLIEAKATADKEIIETESKAKMHEIMARYDARAMEIRTAAEVKAQKEKAQAEIEITKSKQESAEILGKFPSLLRLKEIEAFKDLAKNANARIYFGFDKYWTKDDSKILEKNK